MTRWHKETPLSATDLAESDIDVADDRDQFVVGRATLERLLAEAGYRPIETADLT